MASYPQKGKMTSLENENWSTIYVSVMGYSRKYPHSLSTTPSWVPKNFRISKKDNCNCCRIPEPAHSKSSGIPEF